MRYYQAEIPKADYGRVDELAEVAEKPIKDAGGSVVVGEEPGEDYVVIIVHLPDGYSPEQFIPGFDFVEVHAMQVPLVQDHGITE